MKTEQQVRQMLKTIRTARQDGRVNIDLAVSQEIILGWVLEILPPEGMEFHESLADRTGFRSALAREAVMDDRIIMQTRMALEEESR